MLDGGWPRDATSRLAVTPSGQPPSHPPHLVSMWGGLTLAQNSKDQVPSSSARLFPGAGSLPSTFPDPGDHLVRG